MLQPNLECRAFNWLNRMQMDARMHSTFSSEPQSVREMYGRLRFSPANFDRAAVWLEARVRYIQRWHGAGQPWIVTTDRRTTIPSISRASALRHRSPAGKISSNAPCWTRHGDSGVANVGRTPNLRTSENRVPMPGNQQRSKDHNHHGVRCGGRRRSRQRRPRPRSTTSSVARPSRTAFTYNDLLPLSCTCRVRPRAAYLSYAGRDFPSHRLHGNVGSTIVIRLTKFRSR